MKACFLLPCLLIVITAFSQPDTMTSRIAYVAKYKNNKTCAISYTFDDGLKEHYTLVAPHLNKLGLKGTFVVNGSIINEDKNHVIDTTRMTWLELKEMADSGHEISNHGWAHKNFGRFLLDTIKEDIYKNDSAIFANIGIMPRTFAYPNNTKNPAGVKLASENRVGTRTFQRSVGGKSTNDNLDNWIDSLLIKQDWGVTMTHGITYGYDHFKTPTILWEHLQKVKALEDKIWVGTFREVSAYIKEREDVQLDITKGKRSLVITPHLTLNKALFTEPLTMVVPLRNNHKITAIQGKKKLPVTMLSGKALFNFNPYGESIQVIF